MPREILILENKFASDCAYIVYVNLDNSVHFICCLFVFYSNVSVPVHVDYLPCAGVDVVV
jgi:hypothetical protein